MKKWVITLAVILIANFGFSSLIPSIAYAADCNAASDSNLLSFPTWDRGLKHEIINGTCTLKLDGMSPPDIIFTIALNIIDIALRVVGLLAVGFVIYGGFRYVTSRGLPDEAKKAQDIIFKAVVGLLMAILATVIVSFVVSSINK